MGRTFADVVFMQFGGDLIDAVPDFLDVWVFEFGGAAEEFVEAVDPELEVCEILFEHYITINYYVCNYRWIYECVYVSNPPSKYKRYLCDIPHWQPNTHFCSPMSGIEKLWGNNQNSNIRSKYWILLLAKLSSAKTHSTHPQTHSLLIKMDRE